MNWRSHSHNKITLTLMSIVWSASCYAGSMTIVDEDSSTTSSTTTGAPSTDAADPDKPVPETDLETEQRVEVARMMARALPSLRVRQEISAAFAGSKHYEQKLLFSRFLFEDEQRAAALIAEIAKHNDIDVGMVEQRLKAAPPIEFYIPYKLHREVWTADHAPENLVMVGGGADDESSHAGFDVRGEPFEIGDLPPSDTIVFTLNPLESFTPDGGPVGGYKPIPAIDANTPGLWINEAHITNLGEHWIKGSPELELHIETADTREPIICVEEDLSIWPFAWNMDHNDYYHPFLVLPADYFGTKGENFVAFVIEDDDTRCKIVMDKDVVGLISAAIGGFKSGYKNIVKEDYVSGVIDFVSGVVKLIDAIKGNDDFVGLLVAPSELVPAADEPFTMLLLNENKIPVGTMVAIWRTGNCEDGVCSECGDGICSGDETNENCCSDCACDPDLECIDDLCQCPLGTAPCLGYCVDTSKSPEHCGACEAACNVGEVCNNGQCELNCGQLTECGGACVDLKNDEQNCGSCSNTCDQGYACSASKCVCVPTAEVCNGEDDDCDGKIDEDPACLIEVDFGQIQLNKLANTKGDREFGGHGPEVHVWANFKSTPTSVWVEACVKMVETTSDWTTGERCYTSPPKSIPNQGFYGDTSFDLVYIDQDHASDNAIAEAYNLDPSEYIAAVSCTGDTKGDDICDGLPTDCSGCTIQTLKVKVRNAP